MKSTRPIIVGIVVVLLLLGGTVYILLRTGPEPVGPTGPSFPEPGTLPPNPGPATDGEDLALVLQGGRTVIVSNFTKNPDTKADPQNAGFYLIGQGSSTTRDPSFDITYIATTDFFNIALTQTPLKDARLRAEQYLRATLGLGAEDMCQLRYSVATPAFVSEAYAGTDLRFSFCEDAVAL